MKARGYSYALATVALGALGAAGVAGGCSGPECNCPEASYGPGCWTYEVTCGQPAGPLSATGPNCATSADVCGGGLSFGVTGPGPCTISIPFAGGYTFTAAIDVGQESIACCGEVLSAGEPLVASPPDCVDGAAESDDTGLGPPGTGFKEASPEDVRSEASE